MTVKVVTVGLQPAFFAAHVGLDFGIRKNEPIFSRIVWGGLVRVFVLMHFQDSGGPAELELFGFAALALDLAEQNEGTFELAGETLAVDADVGERAVVFAVGQGHSQGVLGLGMVGADAVFHFGDAEREEVGLDSSGAVELPGCVGERLGELGFDGAFGLALIQEGLRVALVGGVVLGRQDDGLASQSVKP